MLLSTLRNKWEFFIEEKDYIFLNKIIRISAYDYLYNSNYDLTEKKNKKVKKRRKRKT